MGNKPGPRRQFTEAEQAEQAALARRMVADGATWAQIISAFVVRGWEMSPAQLRYRMLEWGIRRA